MKEREGRAVERVRWRETPRADSPFPDTAVDKEGRKGRGNGWALLGMLDAYECIGGGSLHDLL
jgi:hypothetical protein